MIIKNLYFENSVAKPKIPKGRLSNIFRLTSNATGSIILSLFFYTDESYKRELHTFLFFLKNTSGQNIAFVK